MFSGSAFLDFRIFLVALDDPDLANEQCVDWLDEKEKACLAIFERARPRRRYLAAHVALRAILGRVLKRHPARVELRSNAWGRPETDGGLSFNMSHSGSHALVAISERGPIGVDIESGERRVSQDVFDAVSADAEKRDIAARRRFDGADLLRLWVRKEAVLKAFGRGLSVSPRSTIVGVHAHDARRWRSAIVYDRNAPRRFSLIDLDLPPGLLGALSIGGAVTKAWKIDVTPLAI